MTPSSRYLVVFSGALLAAVGSIAGSAVADDTFAGLMNQAMHKMHSEMQVELSGDPDRDFARMMIPHHQGAVDMALVELRYGHDERLRRLAQGIIVEQKQEIEVMHLYLTTPPPRAVAP
jgi:uncharacterized protein (DUF305 family)